jgi:predicted PurR-regulated permease PerM
MKKIIQTILILAIVTVAIMPVGTFAFTQKTYPGVGAVTQNTHNIVDPMIDDLQNQINALKIQCATAGALTNYSGQDEQRLTILESKVTILERTVDFIINQVSNVLAEVIKYLSK